MFCVVLETKKACYHTICRLLLVFETILAESGGFEPADPLTSQQFSRLPQSTTLPTLRRKSTNLKQNCK
jgi:hypothetical protein